MLARPVLAAPVLAALALAACSSEPPAVEDLLPVVRPPVLVQPVKETSSDDQRCLSAIRTYQGSLDDADAQETGQLREQLEIACAPSPKPLERAVRR